MLDTDLICIKVYLTKTEFLSVIKEAEKAKKRAIGLKAFKIKKNSFNGEEIPNTKGVANFLKGTCYGYYMKNEAAREIERLKAVAELEAAQDRLKRLESA